MKTAKCIWSGFDIAALCLAVGIQSRSVPVVLQSSAACCKCICFPFPGLKRTLFGTPHWS